VEISPVQFPLFFFHFHLLDPRNIGSLILFLVVLWLLYQRFAQLQSSGDVEENEGGKEASRYRKA
jgi:hypothetical protein